MTGAGRTLTYTTFNKVKSVEKGNHTVTFAYGPARARTKRTDTDNNGTATDTADDETTVTLYVGNVEKVIAADNTYQYRRTLAGGVALVVEDYDASHSATGTATKYLLRDHLGSLTSIVDNLGAMVQELSYDPWGQRRNAADWQALSSLSLTSFDSGMTRRGFTGHEMVDTVGIIHMNGRIYDATLGRFLQADPVIQFPDYSQSRNRYSYVLNNPLAYTDPSGYIFKKLFKGIKGVFKGLNKALGDFAPFLGIALLAIPGINAWAFASWQNAFSFGFWTGGIATGSLRGALFGGISAAAFVAIGSQFTAETGFFQAGGAGHALTGGILAELQGGQFGHGFLAAGSGFAVGHIGATQGWRAETQFMARVVSAGTVSEITGGKFANGAMTVAFSRLFKLAHELEEKDGFFAKLRRALNFGKISEFAGQAHEGGDPLAHERAAHGYGQYVGSPAIVAVTRTIGEIVQFVGYSVETLTFGAVEIFDGTYNTFTLDYLRDAVRDVEITIQGAQGRPFTEEVPGSGGVP